jgi:excisionase family DNA binding protein
MEQTWLTVDELAAFLKVSPKSIRRAYRKGEIPVDRFCRFVRFDLERVKEALQAKGHGPSLVASTKKRGPRSAQGGASRRRAQRPRPRLGKTGASIADKPRRKK